jgi:DNA-binding CsgD family transcriptional regulator
MVVLSRGSLKLFALLKLREQHQKDGLCRSKSAAQPGVRQRRLSETEVVELRAAYASGTGTMQLAERFGVHRDSVRRHLNDAGMLRPREALTPEQVQLAIKLRGEGLLYREIGERFGVAKDTVRVAILRAR